MTHERGMVHRDIKPQNLMLTHSGVVKVVDFGLARLVQQEQTTLPGSGPTIVGTPDYMSPEQAREPNQADAKSDLYSLGCTLWYLLTGAPPFPRPTPLQVFLAHQHEPARPLREVRQDVPDTVADVLDRLMAKDPAKRYDTAAEAIGLFPRSSSRCRRHRLREAAVDRDGSSVPRFF